MITNIFHEFSKNLFNYVFQFSSYLFTYAYDRIFKINVLLNPLF